MTMVSSIYGDEEISAQQLNNQKLPKEQQDMPYYLEERPDLMAKLLRTGYFRPTGQQVRTRRKFPEVGSKGFEEDIFDEGFGEFSTMKRANKGYYWISWAWFCV